MVVIFAANYVLLLGLRDILYFVLPIGPPAIPRLKRLSLKDVPARKFLNSLVFWLAFVLSALRLINYLPYFLIFIPVAYSIFRAGEKKIISHGALVLLTTLAMLGVTTFIVRGQPVLLRFESKYSVDLWIYNASNSLIDDMMAAGQSLGLNTAGIERLAALVPQVQNNLVVLLFVSLYMFCAVTLGAFARVILPGSGFRPPKYFEIPPVMPVAIVALAALAAAGHYNIPQLALAVGAVYYLWGVNLAIYFMRGGRPLLNIFLAFAGALYPVTIVVFIALGIADNLFDLRRAAAMLGLRPAQR
jgi:hypothetical protein